jgi:hypothetical protein
MSKWNAMPGTKNGEEYGRAKGAGRLSQYAAVKFSDRAWNSTRSDL